MSIDPFCVDCGMAFKHGEELGDECHSCGTEREAAYELKMLRKFKADITRRFDRTGFGNEGDAHDERIAELQAHLAGATS